IIEDYQRALVTMQENLKHDKSYTDVFGIAIEDELYKENH
ncbi:MAG: 3'-5' exonuclease, partial [Epsilonproteobacteria bacterium]|nr:3'-5' exonuclease [Campylobacterota bacterium]